MADWNVLLIGDIVGKPGREILTAKLPELIEKYSADFVIVNGENAAQGSGLTENLFKEIIKAGADVVTTGDHTWRRKEILPVLEKHERALRPHNYPPAALGTGARVFETRSGGKIGVVTVLGRVFMEAVDCPFRTAAEALRKVHEETPVAFLEVHAEATSEKQAIAWHFAGRVSCVFGTHTHVPTADARVLSGGTAYITDLGMTGPYDSVLGRDKDNVIYKMTTSMHAPFYVAQRDVRLCGAVVRVDSDTGRSRSIERLEVAS